MTQETFKKMAAHAAIEQVKNGMVLGLGTGSTARHATDKLGELWQAGALPDIIGIPTSERTAKRANEYGIPLGQLDQYPHIDLMIDGADEVDPDLNLIKGLGGALLREKMVAMSAERFIVVVDETKLVNKLGTTSPLPVEVVQFAWQLQQNWLAELGCNPTLRKASSTPYITDNQNYIIDCEFPNGIDNPIEIDESLTRRAGVVEHGLFLGFATDVVVAGPNGVRWLQRSS